VADAEGQHLGYYQNVTDLSEEDFVAVATGTNLPAQPEGDWPPPGSTWTAVWDPQDCAYRDDLTVSEAQLAYPLWWRETYP
jgi:hypothetical protein